MLRVFPVVVVSVVVVVVVVAVSVFGKRSGANGKRMVNSRLRTGPKKGVWRDIASPSLVKRANRNRLKRVTRSSGQEEEVKSAIKRCKRQTRGDSGTALKMASVRSVAGKEEADIAKHI